MGVDGREIAVYREPAGTGRVLVGLAERLPVVDEILHKSVLHNGGVHQEPNGLRPSLQVPGMFGAIRTISRIRENFTPILAGFDLPDVFAIRTRVLANLQTVFVV